MYALATGAVYVGGYFTNVPPGDHDFRRAVGSALYAGEREATRILRASGFQCGVERWAVKTLSDSEAGQVNFTPARTTIPKLDAIPAPPSVDGARTDPGHAPTELTAYSLRGTTLVGYKEEPDSDIHLALQSTIDPSQTMIAEIPDPNCVSSAFKRAAIAKARADFVAEVGQPTGSYTDVHIKVNLTGVGFFDFLHGQRNVAPNGVELHPVLSFQVAK